MIYLLLFLEFFKIGLFTFGGGYAMIPLIKETVLAHEWISEEIFYDFIGVCESTPGPIAVNMATFVGASEAGFVGALCATLGLVLPSFIIIVLVASILTKFIENKYVKAFLKGVLPVVMGLIITTGFVLSLKAIGITMTSFSDFNYKALIIYALLISFYFIYKHFSKKKKVNNILLIVFSAFLGVIINII